MFTFPWEFSTPPSTGSQQSLSRISSSEISSSLTLICNSIQRYATGIQNYTYWQPKYAIGIQRYTTGIQEVYLLTAKVFNRYTKICNRYTRGIPTDSQSMQGEYKHMQEVYKFNTRSIPINKHPRSTQKSTLDTNSVQMKRDVHLTWRKCRISHPLSPLVCNSIQVQTTKVSKEYARIDITNLDTLK